jgi:N utilization substance protein B
LKKLWILKFSIKKSNILNKMTENSVQKSTLSRRLERAKAFQVIYSLCFNPPINQIDLTRRFQRAIYAEPLPGNVFFTELYPEHTPEAAAEAELFEDNPGDYFVKKESCPLPDIHAGGAENDDEGQVITPDSKAVRAAPEGFAWELVQGVWNKQADLDKLIRGFSQNWRLERMGKVELSLLRLAVYELIFSADVPPKVIINEAIELSRQFGDENSHGFVNGILDAALKAVDNGEIKRIGLL